MASTSTCGASEPSWLLRRAVEADAEALQSIESACFGEPWSLDLLRQALLDPKYLLLCIERREPGDEGELLGYVAAWSVLDEGQIDRLATMPPQRRRGLGRALLAGILSELEQAGAATIFLEVRSGNASAIGLYLGAGFTEAGRRKAYYADGEGALILRLGN